MTMSELHPDLEALVEDWADEFGMTTDVVVQQIERQYGLTLADVEDDDAEAFAQAFEEGDADTIVDLLEQYDVDDDEIEQFRDMVDPDAGNGSGESSDASVSEASKNGDSPSGDAEYVTKQEFEAAKSEIANDTVRKLKSELGAGGGGGQQQAQQGGGGGGLDPGTQKVLAQAISQHFLGGGGGGQAAQLGEEVQKEAMKSFITDLRKPDFGDMLEAKFYKEALGSDVTDDMMADLIPDKQSSEDEMDPFEKLMVEQPDDGEDLLEAVENGEMTAEEAREEMDGGDSGWGLW